MRYSAGRDAEGHTHADCPRPVLGSARVHPRSKPSAAAAFRYRVDDALAGLADFPDSGRVVPENPDLPSREVIVGSHRS